MCALTRATRLCARLRALVRALTRACARYARFLVLLTRTAILSPLPARARARLLPRRACETVAHTFMEKSCCAVFPTNNPYNRLDARLLLSVALRAGPLVEAALVADPDSRCLDTAGLG